MPNTAETPGGREATQMSTFCVHSASAAMRELGRFRLSAVGADVLQRLLVERLLRAQDTPVVVKANA